MAKSLFKLIWWKMLNIRSFCWLRNDCIPDLQGVHFRLYLLLDFFMFLSFWVVFPSITCFRLLFLRKVIIVSIEKVFSKALLVFIMDHWFRVICFILGSVWSYVPVSGNTWVFCVVFGVSKSFLSRSIIFLISVSI